ncbi:PqqD family protein [Kineococcus indalonis]|uniref:PqqD family protein n=1 Tax=Kineococcus indalonis TaxID=2696566 RepID=UPI0014130555|nr:PqqD family protein [Kineococcus indalonis]NAZ86673.1 PqqD family peptide modification chaperone [Kineococcus indalonis]
MDRVAVRADELAWNEVDDQIVVLDTATSTYHAVSGAGVVLWPLLVEGTTRADLLERLTGTFDVDRERAEADLDAFLASCAPLLQRA